MTRQGVENAAEQETGEKDLERPAGRPRFSETIVVEGRDDTFAVRQAADCQTIETHGFGLSDAMWRELAVANERTGLIVLTDPDSAGERIRKKITEKFPDALQAYLPRGKALKGDNVGVENAAPEDIVEALMKARRAAPVRPGSGKAAIFTHEDLDRAGLAAGAGARKRREAVCDALGIGYGNAGAMLRKLNAYGITRKEFDEALRSTDDQIHKE